jgi:predicted transposase/invertase (TIGR01784 family)
MKLMEEQGMKTLAQHLEEMGFMDQWREQWRTKWREQSRAEREQLLAEERAKSEARRRANKIEMASKLKQRGVDYKIIVEATGLSLQEVKRLK